MTTDPAAAEEGTEENKSGTEKDDAATDPFGNKTEDDPFKSGGAKDDPFGSGGAKKSDDPFNTGGTKKEDEKKKGGDPFSGG